MKQSMNTAKVRDDAFCKEFLPSQIHIGHGDNVTKHNFPQKSALC